MIKAEIEKLIEEERKRLKTHQENFDSFLDKGIQSFVSDEELSNLLTQGVDIVQEYEDELNKLILDVKNSGLRLVQLNLKLKNC